MVISKRESGIANAAPAISEIRKSAMIAIVHLVQKRGKMHLRKAIKRLRIG